MPTAIELLERLSAIALAHAMTLEQAIDLHQKLTINTPPLPSAKDCTSKKEATKVAMQALASGESCMSDEESAWVAERLKPMLENKRSSGLL